MNKKKPAFLILLLFPILLFAGCAAKPVPAGRGKIPVTVSFNAMAELVKAVGGDKVAVTTMIPDGTEPHDYEPKPRDIGELGGAKVFVYNGLGLESWVDKATGAAGNESLIAVNASKGIAPIQAGKSKGSYDPHAWMSLRNAQIQAGNIKNALEKADPKDKTYFETNCAAFDTGAQSLYQEYDAKFKAKTDQNLVAGHAAFGYLCRDFGLKESSVEDVFASGEPSARNLKSLTDYCLKNHVGTIFVEDMVSPAVSQTLARQVGAKAVKIYTIESRENGGSYLSRMRYDLEQIDKGLE